MAWVQGPAGVNTTAGSVAATFSASTPAGNLVVVGVTQINGVNPIRSITNVRDNVDTGVDYDFAFGIQDGTPNVRTDIYYKVASSSGTRTVTATFSAAADCGIAINEYDSTHTTLGPTNGNTGTGTSATAGSVTASGASALYIQVLTDLNGVTITPDGSWNQRQDLESNGAGAPVSAIDLITSGAQNPTTTLGASPGNWAAVAAVFESSVPSITVQPQNATSYEGQTATFTITATPSGGSNSYQWKDDGGNVGTDSDTYTTAAATYADNGAQITCEVTDSNGTTVSNPATWTVRMAAKPFYLRA